MSSPPPVPVQVIKASYALQNKVGSGPLRPEVLAKCSEVMNTVTTDFAPIAGEFLDRLEQAVSGAKAEPEKLGAHLDHLTRPVMELKANARMFRYDLVTNLANIMLGFLEGVQILDRDAVEIVAAHHRTLKAIVDRKMMGDGGQYGTLLIQELKDACNRYFQKRGMRALNIGIV